MPRRLTLIFLLLSLGSAAIAAGQSPQGPGGAPPTPAQVQSSVARAIANQHRDDALLEEFDRTEHIQVRKTANSGVSGDELWRVVPIGTGSFRIAITPDGKPANPVLYRQQLAMIQHSLQLALQPDDREKQDLAKYQKRQQERADMVTEIGKAFRFTWLGRETRNGRILAKVQLDPIPSYSPPTRIAGVLAHVRAIVWLDESADQVVHIEAEITSDVYFGAGVLGKLYRGGRFWMDQEEVAAGVWEPVTYAYDFTGRKFMFGFEVHQLIEVGQYRRLGPLQQRLSFIRNELNNAGSNPSGD
jgi:hypothetical protein